MLVLGEAGEKKKRDLSVPIGNPCGNHLDKPNREAGLTSTPLKVKRAKFVGGFQPEDEGWSVTSDLGGG